MHILTCLDISDSLKPQAKYALKMLLLPLGLEPKWCEKHELTAQSLYYGNAVPEKGIPLFYAERAWRAIRAKTLPEFGILPLENHPITQEIPVITDRGKRKEDRGQSKNPLSIVHCPLSIEQTDFLVSAFFWLADVQMWCVRARDVHGRLRYADSVQAQLGYMPLPFVDFYRELLVEMLLENEVSFQRKTFGEKKWALCVTHDIDHLKKWTWKRVVLEKAWHKFIFRSDGYADGLQKLPEIDQKHGFKATYFFKTNAHAPEDDFYSHEASDLVEYVRKLQADGHEIGLHPSYYAHNHEAYLQDETARIYALVQQSVKTIRQHYLRYDEWQTSRLQVQNGFSLDSTFGFTDYEGFRNGTCLPFNVFDFQQNTPLDLWELPLSLHDTTLFQYRALSLSEAHDATKHVCEMAQYFGGVVVALWHNVIYDTHEYPRWAQHFEETLATWETHEALKTTLSETMQQWA